MKTLLGWSWAKLTLAFHYIRFFRQETGQSLLLWLTVALLNLALQIVLRRELLPGEFALFNTVLGVVALMAVPVFALQQAGVLFQPQVPTPERLATFQAGRLPLVQNFTWVWILIASLLLIPLSYGLDFPRVAIGPFTWVNVVLALGAYLSAVLYEGQGHLRWWGFLVLAATVLRLVLVFFLTGAEPLTETALAAVALAGLVKVVPLMRQRRMTFAWAKTWRVVCDQEFRLYFFATLSAWLGIFLFTSADRIVEQSWFGRPANNNLGFVPWGLFDGYQTAGLLGRALLWGTQPLLFLLLAQRAHQEHTTRVVRRIFWIYLGVLLAGAVLLYLLAEPLSQLFGGANREVTAHFIPLFAQAMIPMGLLQGLGFFAIASRRYPECFILGGSSLAYTLFLFLAGTPQVVLSYIFGAGLVVLMLVLFVGVVRWGRTQP